MITKIEIFEQEKELLFKLLNRYKSENYIEDACLNSLRNKLKRIGYFYNFIVIDRLKEIEEELSKLPIERLGFCIEEIFKSNFITYILRKSEGRYTLYTDDYWNEIIRLSSGEVLYIKEAIEILKVENLPAFRKLKNNIKSKIRKNEL